MAIQIFVLHYCTLMLSSSCTNCSAQSVSNYSMPSAGPLDNFVSLFQDSEHGFEQKKN